MRYFFSLLFSAYQRFISPLYPPCCRFYPSCSEYARQAFALHGFFKALYLTVWRLLRCNPLCSGGYDPVPEQHQLSTTQQARYNNGQ